MIICIFNYPVITYPFLIILSQTISYLVYLKLAEPLTPKKRYPISSIAVKKKKFASKKLKWKQVGDDAVSFEMSLLPRRSECPVTDCDVIYDMQQELRKFEKQLAELNNNEVSGETEECRNVHKEIIPGQLKEEILCDKVLFRDIVKMENAGSTIDSYDSQLTVHSYYEDKVPVKVLERLEKFRDNRCCKCLRRKHKWKYQKPHKAIKTKQFRTKNIVKKRHGSKLFINHRLRGCNTYYTLSGNYLPTPRGLGMKDIDSKGFIFTEEQGGRKRKEYKDQGGYVPANRAAAPQRHYPVAQPVPAYALRANNADNAFENDLVNVLINLQNRDLTPEDYELLLRLDERVAPKTVTQDILDSFETDIVTKNEVEMECAVCMEAYQLGQERTHLPCGHVFHKNCIDTWLKNSSLNCPLDGLSVGRDQDFIPS